MAFIDTGIVEELTPGKMKGVIIGNTNILIANIDGRYYATGGKCTHMGGNLSKGILTGKIVTCPLHGTQFDVTTGKVIGGPAKKDLPVYPVKKEGNTIKVDA